MLVLLIIPIKQFYNYYYDTKYIHNVKHMNGVTLKL